MFASTLAPQVIEEFHELDDIRGWRPKSRLAVKVELAVVERFVMIGA